MGGVVSSVVTRLFGKQQQAAVDAEGEADANMYHDTMNELQQSIEFWNSYSRNPANPREDNNYISNRTWAVEYNMKNIREHWAKWLATKNSYYRAVALLLLKELQPLEVMITSEIERRRMQRLPGF